MLLEKLCVMFEDGVLMRLKSDLLKAALCHLLQYFLKFVPAGYESALQVRKVYVRNICKALLDVLGIQVDAEYLLGPLYAALKMESMEIIEEIQCQTQQENLSSNSDGISPKRRRLSSSLNPSKRAPKQTEDRTFKDCQHKSKKKPSVVITWMSLDFYTKVLKSCRSLLESVQKPDLEATIDKVVKIYDALIYMQVNSSFEDHILEDLCGMLSLPWIYSHSDDGCLKLTTFATNLLTLSCRISDSYSPQAQSRCVFLLTLFPRRIFLEWRTAVYNWALQSSHEVIRASCVSGFFILLQQQNSCNRVPRIL
ncbi:ATR isoform 5, partial [Pan troglodytes]